MTDGSAARPADLADRVAAQSAIAAALIDLEGHPAHLLLGTATLRGTTAQLWATGREQLASLWIDFAAYQSVIAMAGDTSDPDELRALLTGPSVEIGRTVVADRITGPVEHVERITLDELTDRMDRTFGEVRDLLRTCQNLHTAFVTRTARLAERLESARLVAANLGAEPETVRARALGVRLHELDSAAAADPLALAEPAITARVDAVAGEVEALAGRLADAARLRGGWAATLVETAAAVTGVEGLRRTAEEATVRAAETVVGPAPVLPPDHTRELRSRLAALDRGSWPTRATAVAELRAAVDAATAELVTVRDLAAGLIDRRAELRGRFEAYRAKAVRLGRVEEPQLLGLDARLRTLLWTRPCDLAAATRALAAYQRTLLRVPTASTREEGA